MTIRLALTTLLLTGCSNYGLENYGKYLEEVVGDDNLESSDAAEWGEMPLPEENDEPVADESTHALTTSGNEEEPSDDFDTGDLYEETEDLYEDTGDSEDDENLDENTQANDPNIDYDGDGYSAASGDCDDTNSGAFPGNQELAGDGIDQDCDGHDASGGGIQCAYNLEMICGQDGWNDVWLWVDTGNQKRLEWPQVCRSNHQSWSPSVSEMVDIQLGPGQQIDLQICFDEQCSNNGGSREIGLILKANGSVLQSVYQPNDQWSFSHICPQ